MRTMVSLAITAIVALALLLACAPAAPTAVPTKAPAVSTTPPAPAAATAAPKVAAATPTAPPKPAATPTPAVKIKRGGTLRVGTRMEVAPNIDPHQVTGMGAEVLRSMYDRLTESVRDEKTGLWQDQPNLAESWEMPNPKTIVMKLRKGVKFHDGSDFNAAAAKWNIDRMKNHPKSAAKNEVLGVDSVDVVDENAIRINLKAAPAGLLATLSVSGRGGIASKTAGDKGEDALTRTAVGTGPFQFVEWKTGDSLSVKRYDRYWDKGLDGQALPYLDGLKYVFRPDKTLKALELRTGVLDLIDELEPKDIPPLKADANLQVVEYEWASQVQYFFYNLKKPPFKDNLKLRQAGLYALDRENAAKALGKGFGYPAWYFWGKGTLGYDEGIPRYNFDAEKAKQLVKEAGYPNGLEVKATLIAREPDNSTAVVMKQMWDQVGLRTVIEPIERTAVIALWQTAGHEAGFSGRGWSVIDPDQYSFRLVTGGAFNFAHWESATMDKCMEEGRNEVADAKRAEIYKRCQRVLYEEATFGESWFMPKTIALNKKVKGWRPLYNENADVNAAWIE